MRKEFPLNGEGETVRDAVSRWTAVTVSAGKPETQDASIDHPGRYKMVYKERDNKQPCRGPSLGFIAFETIEGKPLKTRMVDELGRVVLPIELRRITAAQPLIGLQAPSGGGSTGDPKTKEANG